MAEKPLDRVVQALEERDLRPRGANGKLEARCPAHDDRVASLSIGEGDDDRVLLHCHAGCDVIEIAGALGLEQRDLFEEAANDWQGATSSTAVKAARAPERAAERVFRTPSDTDLKRWREALTDPLLGRLRELRGWSPEAVRGLELGFDGERVVFTVRAGEGRIVGVAHYAPNPETRGDQPKMKADAGSTRGLFPPPETVEGEDIWIVEGEPDAVAAATLGLPVVAIPGAAGWKPEWAERFAGRRVVVVGDCDRPGRELAQRVAGDLAGHATDVRTIDLGEDRDDGHDVGDLLREAAADGADGVASARRLLVAMAEAAEPSGPPDRNGALSAALPDGGPSDVGNAGRTDRTVTAESFAAIRSERTRWLWDQRIPLGTATLLVGRETLGKSTLTAELAAQLSRGRLDGDLAGTPAATLIVTYEDSAGQTIKPRLMAAGADLARVHHVTAHRDGSADLVTLPADVEQVAAVAEQTGARLVIVDPLSASLGADVDGHRDQDIRRALAPLVALAERADLAILCLAHFNKAQGGDALSRVLGSRGLTAAVRSVLTFGRAPDADEDSPERVLAHPASNLAPEAPSLAYRHEGREVEGDDGDTIPTNRLVLIGECDTRADELIATRSHDERTDTDDAAEWLADELGDGDWHESREVKARASAAGHSKRTIQRAKLTLGVEDRRERFPAISEWRLTVAPSPGGATGATDAGATERTRIPEPSTGGTAPQSRQDTDSGATGAELSPATDAEEAEIDRIQAKISEKEWPA